MQKKQKMITAGITLSLAVVSGVAVMNHAALAGLVSPEQTAEADLADATSVELTSADMTAVPTSILDAGAALPAPPAAALARVPLPQPDVSALAGLTEDSSKNWSPDLQDLDRSPFGLACDFTVSATAANAAQVRLSILAPCHGNEAVDIRHGDMMVTEVTSQFGSIEITLPALADPAEFTVSLADGSQSSAEISVPDVAEFDRVILQWIGETGLDIHALEFGADYGEDGHVWRQSPRSAEVATAARGGFITTLGAEDQAEGYRAMAYSFPTSSMRKHGVVRLNVEAEVTAYNCGQDMRAQTLQKTGGDWVRVSDLTLSVPGCDAIGDILLLKNLLQDLKIAQN